MIWKIFVLAAFGAVVLPARGYGETVDLTIQVLPEKTVFAPGEQVKGVVHVGGKLPSTVSGSFTVDIFHGARREYHLFTGAPVFIGETNYTFEGFGIPNFNTGEDAIGQWRIVVTYGGIPPVIAEAKFRVEAEDESL